MHAASNAGTRCASTPPLTPASTSPEPAVATSQSSDARHRAVHHWHGGCTIADTITSDANRSGTAWKRPFNSPSSVEIWIPAPCRRTLSGWSSRRKRALADRAVAQVDVDLAENEWKTRKIALAQAQEALRVAEDQLRYSKIVSPIDGTVIQRTIRVGETVVPGTMATLDERSLLVVADLSVLVAKADLNQIDVAKARLGQEVTLTLDALPGKTYKAKVTKIAPASILPKGKDVEVFPVEATLEGAPPEIKPGMTADVKIHVETRKNVLKLPIEAVVKEKGKTFVNKLTYNPPGKGPATTRVEIQPGVRNDRDQEILGGLSEGDAVLIKPPSAEANEFK